MRQLPTLSVTVEAPRSLVFALLTAYDQSGPLWSGEGVPTVVAREGGTLNVRFRSRMSARGPVQTLERVRLYPPHRLTYEFLEGPFENFRAEMELTELGPETTRIDYRADVEVARPDRFAEAALERKRFSREMERSLKRYRRAMGRAWSERLPMERLSSVMRSVMDDAPLTAGPGVAG